MIILIENYPQIHIFSEFRSKKRAKKLQNRDTMNIFAEQNIAISKRGIYIALVNEKDSVILDGDPIANDDMWQQYKKLIEDYEQKNCKNNKE